jgi:N-acetylmuramoyl-L-alanine amidase
VSVRAVLNSLIGGLFLLFLIYIYNHRVINTTVFIQEGHVGRLTGNIGSVHRGIKEMDWNHLVGEEVQRILEKEGIDVATSGARIPVTNATIAVALHFDGSEKPCSTGASIGHDGSHASRSMARRWKQEYSSFFPFKWHRDNFTPNLSDYYGFSRVSTTKGFLVLELGEITCDEQMDWLKPKLNQVASKIAHFIIKELKR